MNAYGNVIDVSTGLQKFTQQKVIWAFLDNTYVTLFFPRMTEEENQRINAQFSLIDETMEACVWRNVGGVKIRALAYNKFFGKESELRNADFWQMPAEDQIFFESKLDARVIGSYLTKKKTSDFPVEKDDRFNQDDISIIFKKSTDYRDNHGRGGCAHVFMDKVIEPNNPPKQYDKNGRRIYDDIRRYDHLGTRYIGIDTDTLEESTSIEVMEISVRDYTRFAPSAGSKGPIFSS